jgi:putative membrane protein
MSLFSPVATFLLPAATLLAEDSVWPIPDDPSPIALLLQQLLAVVVFAVVGIVVLALCFWIMGKLTSFSIVKEIEEDQNVALGIVLGAIAIGISIIIAAAIIG